MRVLSSGVVPTRSFSFVSVENLPSGVQETLLGTALGLLGLLLLLDLGGLRLDLTGTREGSVNLTHVGLCVIEGLWWG